MKKERILIVEDDPTWIENYKRWLRFENVSIDVSESSSDALEKLRSTYYALVILDLALDPKNAKNRDSLFIQKYLQKHPEGTLHLISSATAEKEDVADAAFKYNAINAFFKPNLEDPTIFIDSIKSGIKKSQELRPDFVEQSYKKLMCGEEQAMFEHKLLKSLNPQHGAAGYLSFKAELLEAICPLELHKTKKKMSIINENFVCGLYWSRQLSSAISICLTNFNIVEKLKQQVMEQWLGWKPEKEFLLIDKNNIIGYIHLEKDLQPDDFILPLLRVD